jgi:molecular chaperone IbpA
MQATVYTIPAGMSHSWIGLDRFLDQIDSFQNTRDNYPPHSIVKLGENDYRLELAVAGFKKTEIVVSVEDGTLSIVGKVEGKDERQYLHHGLAKRSFKRAFTLSEYVEVASADIVDGILAVELKRVIPDHKKPRVIPLGK